MASDLTLQIIRIESKAKILGNWIWKDVCLLGQPFLISITVCNQGHQPFPGGKVIVRIEFPATKADLQWPFAVPSLTPNEEWKSPPVEFNALGEGFALVYVDATTLQGISIELLDGHGKPISSSSAFHGFLVETRRDYHTFFALCASLISLAVLLVERPLSLLFTGQSAIERWLSFLMTLCIVIFLILIFSRMQECQRRR